MEPKFKAGQKVRVLESLRKEVKDKGWLPVINDFIGQELVLKEDSSCLREHYGECIEVDHKGSMYGFSIPVTHLELVEQPETGFDPVNKPSHYADTKIEVIDYIEDKQLGYHLGNAVKYISKAGKKDPAKTKEDLQKAIWYINRFIEKL